MCAGVGDWRHDRPRSNMIGPAWILGIAVAQCSRGACILTVNKILKCYTFFWVSFCVVDFISFVFYCSSKWLFDWRDWRDDTDEPLFQFDSASANE